LHNQKKLTLVFEFCDSDLKKYLDHYGGDIDTSMIKVDFLTFMKKRSRLIKKLIGFFFFFFL